MDPNPCSVCGASVRIEKQPTPRKASKVQQYVDARVCTAPGCASNGRKGGFLKP